MQACYPVARRGKSIVWSGIPFHGPSQFKESIVFYAQSAAERAFEKGYPGKKKGDLPSFVWLETEQDALFRNNAKQVTVGDNDRYNLLKQEHAAGVATEAEVAA